jgi:hypothetical protein
MFSRYMGKPANKEVIAEHAAKLDAKLDGYEAILSKQKYLAGDVRLQPLCSTLPPDQFRHTDFHSCRSFSFRGRYYRDRGYELKAFGR